MSNDLIEVVIDKLEKEKQWKIMFDEGWWMEVVGLFVVVDGWWERIYYGEEESGER